MIAQGPTTLAFSDQPTSAPGPVSEPTTELVPFMITVEAGGTTEVQMITETPSVEMSSVEKRKSRSRRLKILLRHQSRSQTNNLQR